MNVRDAGFKKSGSKAMDKDDNVGMVVPKGYAILGYDHDDCDEGGRGVGFYHGYRITSSSGNRSDGVYSWDQHPLVKRMSSWKVYDLNRSIDFKGVMEGLDSIDSSDSISANKDSYKKTLCQNVDKNKYDIDYTVDPETRREHFRDACNLILTSRELDGVWPESTPAVVPTVPSEESDDDPPDESDDDPPDDPPVDPPVDPPADPPADPPVDKDTNWLLYGGIAAGVCSILVILVIVLMMKKKKPSNNLINNTTFA
jgi:hypothetical protein